MATFASRGAASWAADADQKGTLFFKRYKKEFLRLGLAAYLKDMLHEIKSLQIGYKLAERHAT